MRPLCCRRIGESGLRPEERLAAEESGAFLIDPPYYDVAICKFDGKTVIYNYDKLLNVTMEQEGWSEDEADEWIARNIVQSLARFGQLAPRIWFPPSPFGSECDPS